MRSLHPFVVHPVADTATASTRNVVTLLAVVLLLAACEPVSAPPTTTTLGVLPPPDPIESTTTVPVSTTELAPARSSEYHGFLPDGTEYTVFIEGVVGETTEGVSAGIVIDVDGAPNSVGIATFPTGDTELGYSLEDGVYRIPAGGAVHIEFYDHILEELGNGAADVIQTSITGVTRFDQFPVLTLEPPFRWASDDELPLSMEVQYRHFVVRRGCGDLAVACNETRGLQVIPIDTQDLPVEAWNNIEVFVESPAPRPPADANYLDPGPLGLRQSADVIWTGEEMIVWGGKPILEGLPTLVDGAVFNPETGAWRTIASFPLFPPKATRAIWADNEMLVVNIENVYGYDPVTDSWRLVADGVSIPQSQDQISYSNGKLYVWFASAQLRVLDVATGVWEAVATPTPDGAHADRYFQALRFAGDRVFAVIVPGSRGSGKDYWELRDGMWSALPSVSLAAENYADDSLANQAAGAGGELVIWQEEQHPVKAYSPESGEWKDLPTIPLGGAEGPDGPIYVDANHFMVPRWGEGAIYSAKTESWTPVTLPGGGGDGEIIWTGTEFLAWTGTDAWRWTPPSEVLP
jgi:hypothetical protein